MFVSTMSSSTPPGRMSATDSASRRARTIDRSDRDHHPARGPRGDSREHASNRDVGDGRRFGRAMNERVDRLGIEIDVMRSRNPLGGIRRQQCQGAERRVDASAQTVIETDGGRIVGQLRAEDVRASGEKVGEADELIADRAGLDTAGPADDERNAMPAVKNIRLGSAEVVARVVSLGG